MRQLTIYVPRGRGLEALEISRARGGVNVATFPAAGADREYDIVLVSAPNENVEHIVSELEKLGEIQISLPPAGVLALRPPPDEAPDQVLDVTHRSPVEVFLGGMQSIGSWRGFLGYAVCAGIIVWIGLYTNTIFLLTASMLIAPFAGPAMNLAVGTARGDRVLIVRSLGRYFASVGVTVATACLLTLVIRQQAATELMVDQSLVPSMAILLPLVAGAAGALNLCQSERASLVSGAATGMLVAASLAPPAGVLGMSIGIGDGSMASSAFFLLLLQLVGINLSGTAVFRLFGLTPEGVRFARGERWLRLTSVTITAAGLAVLLGWQFASRPDYQRSTRSHDAVEEVRTAVDETGVAHLVEANARFTRADVPGQESLLVTVYAQPRGGVKLADNEIAQKIRTHIVARLQAKGFQVTPLVDVTVVKP